LRYIASAKRTALSVMRVDFMRWPISFFIGIVTAMVALGIQFAIEKSTKIKYFVLSTWFQNMYEEHDPIISYLISVSFNIVACLVATLCCAVAPEAVGSGIPQIKAYLNGVNIPRLMRFKTLMGKTVGVVFSVLGGLAVGKEGPMIHSGAVVAAGLSQGKATSLPITTKYNRAYRTDREKRDFVACGAAAGVASAFGAPLGGLLFAIEEGASYINHSTLWRVAMSAITSFFVLNIFSSVFKGNNDDFFMIDAIGSNFAFHFRIPWTNEQWWLDQLWRV
jgi:chloride channel 7